MSAIKEYRETKSWQLAMGMGPQLVRLAEELPVAEEHGLSLQIRQLMVEVPAGVAADMLRGDQDRRLLPVLKLVAALELIDRVYPAPDTADARTAVDALADHLIGDRFDERKGGKSPAQPEHPRTENNEAPTQVSAPVAIPAVAAPSAAATNVIPLPAPAVTHEDSTNPALKISVVPGQENHVQPNSVQ